MFGNFSWSCSRLIAVFSLPVLLATGCSSLDSTHTQISWDELPELPAVFGDRPALVELADIHHLNPEQESAFMTYFNSAGNQQLEPQLRLANFLFNNTDNFLYESKTYTASDALALSRGNCMSLAVVTTALANLAELDIEYQLIDSSPVYEMKDNVANKGVHIRSLIYQPDDSDPNTTRSGIKIDYFPGEDGRFIGNVTFEEYIALYYRNIAAQGLSEGNYADTHWYSLESMQYDPLSPDAHNMLAVAYKRVGDLTKAEEIYQYGIHQASNKLTLLKNYHILLSEQGREEEAEAVSQRLATMDDPSPVHWFKVARYSYESDDYNEAILYYNRAIEIAPYLHEAHLGIALSYYQLGQYEKAQVAFQRALLNVNDVLTRERYAGKLEALESLRLTL